MSTSRSARPQSTSETLVPRSLTVADSHQRRIALGAGSAWVRPPLGAVDMRVPSRRSETRSRDMRTPGRVLVKKIRQQANCMGIKERSNGDD